MFTSRPTNSGELLLSKCILSKIILFRLVLKIVNEIGVVKLDLSANACTNINCLGTGIRVLTAPFIRKPCNNIHI